MNPLGFVIIGMGIIFIIVGVKGSQHSIISAFTGGKSGGSTAATNSSVGTPGPGQSAAANTNVPNQQLA